MKHSFGIVKVKVLFAQLYPNLCDPMDYSLPGSYAIEISSQKILEWVAISYSSLYKIVSDSFKYVLKDGKN